MCNTPHQKLEPSAAPQPQHKPRKSITIANKAVQVKGKDHIIQDVPKTHFVIHHTYLKKLQKKASQIDKPEQSGCKAEEVHQICTFEASVGSCTSICTRSLVYGCQTWHPICC
jgi:hypothetical protein